MHRLFDYNIITDESKRKAKAISDIKDWVGPRKFVKITREVKRCVPAMSADQFALMCDIGGIQGYPVRIWAEHCGIVLTTLVEEVTA